MKLALILSTVIFFGTNPLSSQLILGTTTRMVLTGKEPVLPPKARALSI